MSRTQKRWILILITVFAAVLAACQPAATPTPTARPTNTAAPPTEAVVEVETEEATEAAPEVEETEVSEAATEEATEEMSEVVMVPTEAMEATEEVVMEATEEVEMVMEPTEEMTAEMTAELGTLVEVAEEDGSFTLLLAALEEAGLTETLNGEGPFTVFAPTDDAITALLEEGDMTADDLLAREDLADVLQYHVVDGSVTSDELEDYQSTDDPDLIVVPTLLEGEDLEITIGDDGTVTINGVAEVTLANVEASNGVIHVIDAVLMPPSEEAVMEPTEEAVVEMEVTDEMVMEPTEEAAEEEMVAEPTEAPDTEMAGEMGPSVMIGADDSIVIGLAVGLSGEGIAPLGQDIQRGAELALEDRPTVTVDGVEFAVALDVQDDLCSAEGGQAVANRFASDGSVVGVVGPMCSSACRAAAPIFDAAGYSSISPSCTAPDLTTSDYTSFNRAVVSDAFQGAIAADYIYNVLGLRSIATIHDGSTYGEGLVTVVTERFEELGGEVVSSDAVSVGDTDFRGLLDDIAQAEPELIYFGGFPAEASRLIQQRADAGLEDVAFMSADGVAGTEVIDLSGEAAEGLYATKAIPASSQALSDFLTRYTETYGEEPPAPYHANGYDAVNIILDGVEAVGTVDENGDLVVDRAALQEYIRSFSDFQGLTGVLNADGTGETSVADIGILQVQDGEFVQLYTGSAVDDGVALTPFEAMEEPAEEMEATEEAPAEEEMEATAEATEAN